MRYQSLDTFLKTSWFCGPIPVKKPNTTWRLNFFFFGSYNYKVSKKQCTCTRFAQRCNRSLLRTRYNFCRCNIRFYSATVFSDKYPAFVHVHIYWCIMYTGNCIYFRNHVGRAIKPSDPIAFRPSASPSIRCARTVELLLFRCALSARSHSRRVRPIIYVQISRTCLDEISLGNELKVILVAFNDTKR